ncbi:MAG: AAA family ATPase [Thermoplasmatales archaeon]|nr:AAA family ATPase [Thermoplasmatales archaeon]
MILKDEKKLDLSYIPDKILCRDEEIKRIKYLIKSGKVLISGGVGTGKTMIARYIGGDAYVNCYINRTEHRILEEILKQIKPRFNPSGLPTQKLWNEIDGKRIIIDEIDGMDINELKHFAYTLSRQKELGKKIGYIAITRSYVILKQMLDEATWSTFAQNSVVELKPYSWEQMREILFYRAEESLNRNCYDDETISFIADIAIRSVGHARTGVLLLLNSSLIADAKMHKKIEVEDVREANREENFFELDIMEKEELLLLLSVADACKNKAYVSYDEIKEKLALRIEQYGLEINEKKFEKIFKKLLSNDLINEGKYGYTILNFPANLLIKEIEKII